MKSAIAILLILVVVLVGYIVMKPGSSEVDSQPPQDFEEARVPVEDLALNLDREVIVQTSGSTTEASPDEATLHWSKDPELLAAIQQDFNSTFKEQVARSEAAHEANQIGEFLISEGVGRSGATLPGLQLRVEDFTSLTQQQKCDVTELLYSVADKHAQHHGKIPAGLSTEDSNALIETVLTQAIYFPPEVVLEAQGLQEKLKNPEFVYQIRQLRIRIFNQAAPHLTQLGYATRYALGAAMRAGVDPSKFGKIEENAALITPMIREQQLLLEAISREFVVGCDEIGSRFN